MAVVREIWSDNISLISQRLLARGSKKRAVLDLTGTSPYIDRAELFIRIGRTSTTAIAATAGVAGVKVKIREMFNGATKKHPLSPYDRLSGIAAAVVGLINNGAGYIAGTDTFVVDSTSLVPAAGAVNKLCFTGSASDLSAVANDTTTSNAEFSEGSFSSATSLIVDSPCEFARIDNERITTQADIFAPIKLDGQRQYEIEFDYGEPTSGVNVIIEAVYKTMVWT